MIARAFPAAARGACVLGLCLASAAAQPPASLPSAPAAVSLVGRKVGDFAVRTFDGAAVRLSDLHDGEVLFIQFYTSYCAACREEVPQLNEAHGLLKDRGLRVVAINFGETPQEAQRFVRDTGPAYPVYLDPEGSAAKAFHVTAVPLNVVIDRRGVILHHEVEPPKDVSGTLARYLTTGEWEPARGLIGRVAHWFQSLLAAESAWAAPLAFLGGVLSVLLPCVYPVIPVAAAFFGARAGGSRGGAFALAAAYALGMALLVTALGLIALALRASVGNIAANPWVNVAVGVVIVLLSLPVMGVLHLRTPAALGKAQGRAASMQGLPAAFLLGMVSGPVVSVCVAPIMGAILVGISLGGVGVGFGTLLMLLYGLGLGLPFVVLGTFTGLLKSIPKPGPWMRVVQVAFGILLALVGLYFLVVRGILQIR